MLKVMKVLTHEKYQDRIPSSLFTNLFVLMMNLPSQ